MATEKYYEDLKKKKTIKRIKLVPPDGGWGWMVLLGTAMSNIVNQSLLSTFSLLYGDQLEAMGYNTKGAALVLSTMLFVANFGGPIAGAIVKLSSPRIVSVIGACLCTSGIFLSSFTTNIMHLVLSYGVLLGAGLGFIQNSSFVAINSYFKLKKSRAVGLANVGTAMGQILMPHLVGYLLENYGFRGTCILLGGISLHGICGTLLIQPVQWHMKKIEEEVEVDESSHLLEDNKRRKSVTNGHKEISLVSKAIGNEPNGTSNETVKTEQKKTLLQKIADTFDLALLSKPRFLNIIIGTSLAVTSIQNFSMLYPLFLQKSALMDKESTAMCMSAVATGDITGRLVLPVFQDKYRIKARWMLIGTCVWLILTRQIMAYQSDLTVLLALSCVYGFGRSTVIVSRNIAISEYCKADQVPAAVGLGMLTMGIIVPPAGYFLGWIRDYTKSYAICITAQNFLLVILLVAWVPDLIYLYMQEKKSRKRKTDLE